jgi:hypothetical protein
MTYYPPLINLANSNLFNTNFISHRTDTLLEKVSIKWIKMHEKILRVKSVNSRLISFEVRPLIVTGSIILTYYPPINKIN